MKTIFFRGVNSHHRPPKRAALAVIVFLSPGHNCTAPGAVFPVAGIAPVMGFGITALRTDTFTACSCTTSTHSPAATSFTTPLSTAAAASPAAALSPSHSAAAASAAPAAWSAIHNIPPRDYSHLRLNDTPFHRRFRNYPVSPSSPFFS
jgi:hypothetical protein